MSKSLQNISAQVILRSALDEAPDVAIVAANIAGALPAEQDMMAAIEVFRKLGFEVGEAAGTSFSISANTNTFEKVFKVKIKNDTRKGIQSKWKDNSVKDHLPLNVLPKETAAVLKAIVFPPIPDFGPRSY